MTDRDFDRNQLNYARYVREALIPFQERYKHVPKRDPERPNGPIRVGILGGGAAGLYTGLLLNTVNANLGQEVFVFDILEANPDRLGGRLWSQSIGNNPDPNDYIDVGAMRFPAIPIMDRTFKLFDKLGITVDNKKTRIPYIMTKKQNLNFFNGEILTNAAIEASAAAGNPDPFATGQLRKLPEQEVNDALQIFIQLFSNPANFKDAWTKLMDVDQVSMRTYLQSIPNGYDQAQINTLESFESGTNFYDSALSEMVMEWMTFHWPAPKEVPWWTVQGGSSVIVEKMNTALFPPNTQTTSSLQMGTAVTAISPTVAPDGSWTSVTVDVTKVNGPSASNTYDHVVSTLPFGCLRSVDTSKCNFDWEHLQAIRSLQYANSVKVGIRFKKKWWEELDKPQKGGVSSTDRPTRMIIYPSYGIEGSGTTMLVSYSWGQDANRLGALCQGNSSDEEMRLVNLIMRDLADIHGITDFDTFSQLYDSHFAWNWDMNQFSCGAFALFGPGQFKSLYPNVTASYGGRLHFAGEATSVHHAWLVGALNSAFRAVYQILHSVGMEDQLDNLMTEWGKDEEFDPNLYKRQLQIGHHRPILRQNRERASS
ncbi:hypothetical protein FRC17_004807 [Serendipita sp. 399]|nr:hypothetical protein FRC17_004807 [Serendipita sp. 399]